MPRQRIPGGFQRRAGAYPQPGPAVEGARFDTLELGHGTDVNDVAQVAKLLVDPQTHVGRAG